jgi:iduronate 2-sulfatase
MRLTTIFLAVSAFCAFVMPVRAEHYDLFIMAGQSNMDGRAKTADLKEDLARWKVEQRDVIIAYSNSGTKGKRLFQPWTPLMPGYSVRPGKPPVERLPGETFGPEVSFGRTLADSLKTPIALIKFAEGGTSLKKDWKVGEPGGLYARMMPFVQEQMEALKARGDTYTLRGFAWHQGESDSGLTEEQYGKLLKALVLQVRRDLDSPNLPVVIGEVYDNHERDAVRAAEKGAAKGIPYCAVASADKLKTQDEGTHFDAGSQIELRKRMALAILPLLQR